MSKKETAGIIGGVFSLGATLMSMIDPAFLAQTSSMWYPMVTYFARFGPNIPGLPERAILTVATTMFVAAMGYRLYNKRTSTDL